MSHVITCNISQSYCCIYIYVSTFHFLKWKPVTFMLSISFVRLDKYFASNILFWNFSFHILLGRFFLISSLFCLVSCFFLLYRNHLQLKIAVFNVIVSCYCDWLNKIFIMHPKKKSLLLWYKTQKSLYFDISQMYHFEYEKYPHLLFPLCHWRSVIFVVLETFWLHLAGRVSER